MSRKIRVLRTMTLAISIYFGFPLAVFCHMWLIWPIFNVSLSVYAIKYPLLFISGYYLLMVYSFYLFPQLFNELYYYLYLLLGLFFNMYLTCFGYFIICCFLSVNEYFGLAIYCIPGIIMTVYGIYKERTILVDRILLEYSGLRGNKITIAHLSDLHLGALYQREFVLKLVKILEKENPDVVVITGDIVDGNIKITTETIEPLNQLKMPVYYITGNHEQFGDLTYVLEVINSTNIKHLSNTSIIFNNQIKIIGIDYDKNKEHARNAVTQIGKSENDINLPNVVLNHVPLFSSKTLHENNIFLLLCGHTHGGQLFPFHLEQYLLYPCFCGLYSYQNSHVYVSSGVGTSGPPIRTLSSSVIGMITIQSSKENAFTQIDKRD